MSLEELLSAAAVGGIAGALATLVSTVLKDLIFPRYLEEWKTKRELSRVFRKYKDPILLSSTEILYRIDELFLTELDYLVRNHPVLPRDARETPTYTAPFYRQYKFESTVYRFCALLGWLELYRIGGRFLNAETEPLVSGLDDKIDRIQAVLADRKLNAAPNWQEWNDRVIFREEQRAIAQMMLTIAPDKEVSVLGYKEFCDRVVPSRPEWLQIVEDFLTGIQGTLKKDSRIIRLRALCIHLIDVIDVLRRLAPDSPLFERRREHVDALRRHVRDDANVALFLYTSHDLQPTQ
ncbi:MAG: hypothetical protein WCC22_12100 [Terriglobales bacterium]